LAVRGSCRGVILEAEPLSHRAHGMTGAEIAGEEAEVVELFLTAD